MVIKMIDDENFEDPADIVDYSHHKRKRIMILLLPLIIVIGISVGIYFALNNDYNSLDSGYNIVQYNKDDDHSITVFYDLPELKTQVLGKEYKHELKLKINLELSSIEDLKIIEILTPKLTDTVLNHIVELNFEEISGSSGMYWLKEEILYRLNLAASPIKIKTINFSVFELQK